MYYEMAVLIGILFNMVQLYVCMCYIYTNMHSVTIAYFVVTADMTLLQ